MVNGKDHIAAQDKLIELFLCYDYNAYRDFEYKTGSDRASKYFFDVYAIKYEIKGWFYFQHIALPIFSFHDVIVVEIDGSVGHSTKKAFANRKIKKQFCKEKGIRFFEFPTKWLVGRKAVSLDFLARKEFKLIDQVLFTS